jgi:hypothetical protein
MVEKYGDTHSSAGWVWAIVGIIVAALVVWWIAAAVSDNTEPTYESQAVSANEEAGAEGGEFAQNEPTLVEDNQAIGSDQPIDEQQQPQMGGEDPMAQGSDPMGDVETQNVQGQPEQLQALNEWNQQQQRAELTPDSINEGVGRLNQAAGGVLLLFSQAPQAGAQVGGGPSGSIAESVSSQRAQLDQSIQALKEAETSNQSQAFHAAAQDFVSLLDEMQAQANLDSVNEPLEQLRQGVSQIEPGQPLTEQQQQVQSFFDQGAEVLNVFAQNVQPSNPGAGQMQQPAQQPMQQQPMQQQPMQNEGMQ